MSNSRLHSILSNPHEYDLCEFRYHVDDDPHQSFVDLTLRNHAESVTLRFWRPRKLKIEEGFPQATGGMVFYDLSADGLEDIGIEVADFEACPGSVTFFAKSVERVG
jgi:hypothetical protein